MAETGSNRAKARVVVGVAGSYCAGKSTVAQRLVDRGFVEINVDKTGHQALRELSDKVVQHFGHHILGEDGLPDRRKVGEIVFANPQALAELEAILHPRMVEIVEQRLKDAPGQNCVVDAALLFPMGLHRLCDFVMWVDACLPLRLLRALRRDKFSLLAVLRRIARQRRLSAKFSADVVDIDTVRNYGSRRSLDRRIDSILQRRAAG
ncbi:MAG: dephospho-CoA kinase [Spirochaetaceae bacterium]|nr:MAG: dephospho-CoA kinase [Spirochaetaceae bacterium]